MDMSGMAPAASAASSTPSTSGMDDSSENMMMMMQMYFYASTKVTLWFHSWSISSRGECAPICLHDTASLSSIKQTYPAA